MQINEITDKIFKYYEDYGDKNYIGEDVTQIEHMIQAAMLAEEDKKSNEIILAALFHDIGHLIEFDDKTKIEKMGDLGVKNHEKVGADFLRKLNVPSPIPELVEGHVLAKRYLTYKYPDYHDKLSGASKETLIYQGGAMTKNEAEEFEKDSLSDIYLKMRDYDDKAKLTDIEIKPLTYYKIMFINLMSNNLVV
jgi:2-amino-1-hydroxyethylphosphonate dioxygenase (glycine-forming)